MKSILLIFSLLLVLQVKSQFAPPVGQEGSTAIAVDSTVYVAWGESCELYRGWKNIGDTTLGKVSYGDLVNALGLADNSVVSLGDGGSALYHFNTPIANGEGFDFAIFENAFDDSFLELAFVEVSSDGENFYRFPAISLTQTETQINTFGTLQATDIHNLAGKYRAMYGTPFDLAEMDTIAGLDINHITEVKIVDVVGSIADDYTSLDSQGNKVNDPFPTSFESGGFDLDAIGIIHDLEHLAIEENPSPSISLFPNPASNFLFLSNLPDETKQIRIYQWDMRLLLDLKCDVGEQKIDISSFSSGTYLVEIIGEQRTVLKFIKLSVF